MGYPNILKNQFTCKQGAVRTIRFNFDGNYCITGGSDESIKLWNPFKSSLLKTYMGHGYEVLDVQSSADSSHIASGGMDKSIFYWDVSTAQIVRKFRGHAGMFFY
nr:WD repeat domain-containing protein 83-like [Parasteatoda tepidariorum]